MSSVGWSWVQVTYPSKPDGWVNAWRIDVEVYSNDEQTLVNGVSRYEWTPGAIEGVGNLQPNTTYKIRFRVADPDFNRTANGPFTTFTTAPLPPFPESVPPPSVQSVTTDEIEVVVPPVVDTWIDNGLEVEVEVFESDGSTSVTQETIEQSDIQGDLLVVPLSDPPIARSSRTDRTILSARPSVASGATLKLRFVVRDVVGGRQRVSAMTEVKVGQRSLIPRLSVVAVSASGYSVQVSNYDKAFKFTATATSGQVKQEKPSGNTVKFTVSGLRPGTSSTLAIATTRTGYAKGEMSVAAKTLLAGLAPTFSRATSTSGGFTVSITNYDASFRYAVRTTAGVVTVGRSTGRTLPITVTGLRKNSQATLTVSVTKTGYQDTSGSVKAKSAAR